MQLSWDEPSERRDFQRSHEQSPRGSSHSRELSRGSRSLGESSRRTDSRRERRRGRSPYSRRSRRSRSRSRSRSSSARTSNRYVYYRSNSPRTSSPARHEAPRGRREQPHRLSGSRYEEQRRDLEGVSRGYRRGLIGSVPRPSSDSGKSASDMRLPAQDKEDLESIGSLPSMQDPEEEKPRQKRSDDDHFDEVSELSFNLSDEGTSETALGPDDLQQRSRSPQQREHRPNSQRPAAGSKPCLICKSLEHRAKYCPKLICYKCQERGHFAKECTNPAAPRAPPPPKPRTVPPVPPVIRGSGEVPRKPKVDINLVCHQCQDLGHRIKDCPKLDCKRCGGKGHFAKECTYAPNQFKNLQAAEQKSQPSAGAASLSSQYFNVENVVSYDYGHSSTAKAVLPSSQTARRLAAVSSGPAPGRPSMLSFLQRRYSESGKDPQLAEKVMFSWRMAGHTEESLCALYNKEQPNMPAQLRLTLVKEFSKIKPSHIPATIVVGDLLDDTVAYFVPDHGSRPISSASVMPSATRALLTSAPRQKPYYPTADSHQSRSHSTSNYPAAGPSHSTEKMERFQDINALIANWLAQFPHVRIEFEARLSTLEALKTFIETRIGIVAEIFGISHNSVTMIAVVIQRLLAHVGLSMATLRRLMALNGGTQLTEAVTEKLAPFAESFRSGITVSYIVSLVKEFLSDRRH